jgi:ElaB/YqjD/DUF883 family membrane-anchored ribosome-binding protein
MTLAQEKLKEARQSAERALKEGRHALEHGVEAGEAKIAETVRTLKDREEKLRTRASHGLAKVRATARDSAAAIRDKGSKAQASLRHFRDDCGTYVQAHPVASLAIASSLGLALGLVLRGRSRASA